MLVGVIGGGLQGVEASYLAKKAGWDVLLVDKKSNVPAIGLCDKFIQDDVQDIKSLNRVFKNVNIIIPALEDDKTLKNLCKWQSQSDLDVPFAFDMDAYKISCSKIKSNDLFKSLDIAVPLPWPECGFPVIIKPSCGSGSKEVKVFNTQNEMDRFFDKTFYLKSTDPPVDPFGKWVLQQYISGHSYSLEVIGSKGNYNIFQTTKLEMDAEYDCKRVIAPAVLEKKKVLELELIAKKIASAINLKGIMDIEVIFHKGRLKVLEIDARLPSQTPIAVFHSTGLNMVKILAQFFLNTPGIIKKTNIIKYVILEHIMVTQQSIYVKGEHIMKSHNTPLFLYKDFFGANEAITNYKKGRKEWVAALIISGETHKHVRAKREQVIIEIKDRFNIKEVVDIDPYDRQ